MMDSADIWHGRTSSAAQTQAIGRIIARRAKAGDLIALSGDLGAGKTQLVKGLAGGLNIAPSLVASPTFVLVHEYEPARRGAAPVLVHIDAYRLKSLDDLESIGWDADSGRLSELRCDAVVVVEWADRIADSLDKDVLEIRLAHDGEQGRRIELQARGEWRHRFDELTAALTDFNDVETTPCPICGQPVKTNVPTLPFCGERCRLADLNRWLRGDYKITRPVEQSDLDEP